MLACNGRAAGAIASIGVRFAITAALRWRRGHALFTVGIGDLCVIARQNAFAQAIEQLIDGESLAPASSSLESRSTP
jgi:hypothetical protein